MPHHMNWLWTSGVHSSNPKTGKIPTAYPADWEAAWHSCEGCSLRTTTRKRNGRAYMIDREEPRCYFWTGLQRLGAMVVRKYAAAGKDYSLAAALRSRLHSTKAVRMSQGGDPSSTDKADYHTMWNQVKEQGLSWLDYTHFWRTKGAWLKGKAMASCDTWQDATQAVRQGWRATVHVPTLDTLQGTKDGATYTLCPSQRGGRKHITCNDCRLCDASKPYVDIIVFLNH